MRERREGIPLSGDAGDVYSHSRLSAFENCPRKFQYRYLWKLPAESESIEGFVGKRVHEVLERLHRVASTAGVPSLPRVLFRFQQLFADAYDANHVRIAREGTPLDFYRAIGEQCLANYYNAHYPFDRDETLALEEHVTFELGGGPSFAQASLSEPEASGAHQVAARSRSRYALQGFVDRIARTRDGAIEIQDYKTSARLPSQAQVDDDRQLALYQIGVGQRFGGQRPVRLVWHYLRQRKTLVSTRTPEQLDALADDTRALIDRIRGETAFEAKPSALCRWCEYREGCPASPERRADRPVYASLAQRAAGERSPAGPRAPARAGRPAPEAGTGAQLALAFS